jgi:2-phosphoglycerate kinase
MLAVAFDTLKLARKLESAGMQPKQAQDMSAALAETLTEWHSVGNLATKDDIQELKLAIVETKAEIAASKTEILKWLFRAIGAQTFILLAALFGLLHSVAKF